MEFFNIAQIKEAKTSDLIAFYNANQTAEKQIKKFTNRDTAETRCIALMDVLNSKEFDESTGTISEKAQEQLEKGEPIESAPVEHKPILNAPSAGVQSAFYAAPAGSALIDMLSESPAKTEKANATPKAPRVRTSNSAGVAASWADPAVAAARLTRNGVTVEVDGVTSTFKSTADAFREHRLPVSKHIRFRGVLKAAKAQSFEYNGKTYNFTIV